MEFSPLLTLHLLRTFLNLQCYNSTPHLMIKISSYHSFLCRPSQSHTRIPKPLNKPALDRSLVNKHSFSKEDLVACGHGKLFGPGRAQLPIGEMLMVDRIIEINETGGKSRRGQIIAELDITPDLWFFDRHFINDPVMPGCL